jgi:alkylation response protein AidB-like acyl-CoA dehydrogenase
MMMDFTFTEEQRMMASTFRELLDEICSPHRLRATAEGSGDLAGGDRADGDDYETRWRKCAAMGLMGVLAPDEQGGLGLADVDFVLLAEEAGHAALPEPLVEHAGIAVPVLAELAAHPRVAPMLGSAAAGRTRVSVQHHINPFVLGAARSNYLLLALGDEIHLVESARTRFVREPSIDPLRDLFKVESQLNESTRIATGQLAEELSRRVLARGALYCAAQLVGLCARMIELATAYARERRQFGKQIGSYQAIKHQLATARVKLELARPVLYAAATRVGSLDPRAQAAISHAKMAASDAADLAARTSLQVHGAMGYSWEVDLHFFMKRAWALAGAWGDRGFHMRRLSALVLDGGLQLGPGHTFEELPT